MMKHHHEVNLSCPQIFHEMAVSADGWLMEFLVWRTLELTPHETHAIIRSEGRNDFCVLFKSFFVIGSALKNRTVPGFNSLPIVFEGRFYLCCCSAGSKDKSIWKC